MSYPDTMPGWKGSIETGREGAASFAPKLKSRQAEVLADLKANGPSTAEQIAERTGRHWYLTRPRISELKAQGRVVATDERQPTGMGGKTHVVRLSTPEEFATWLAAREARQ